MTDRASFGVGGNNLNLADLAQFLPGREDALGIDAVVVGQQDQRFCHDFAINDAPSSVLYWTGRRWKIPSWSSCGPRLATTAAACAVVTTRARSSARSAITTTS